MQKKILVTGAAGFIGFHLAQYLKARGDDVIGLDNFNDYYSPALKRQRAHFLKEKGIALVEGDICNGRMLHDLMERQHFTHVVNLAAQAGVRYSLTNPQAYIKANIEGFTNILEVCRNYPETPLIYASSSSVYGRNTKVPFDVQDRVDHQASLYGVTKKTNELLADTYHHLYNIPVTGLRFFTVYGPWGRPDMAYYSFTKAIMLEQPIDVYNYGKLKRDFTYIDDIVKGIVAAIDLGAKCELFNLGNNQPVSLEEFIETLETIIGKKAIRRFLPMQAGDVLETYADISHSQSQLKFIPQTSLKQGLERFVDWYKQNTSY
ncbi:MAG: NAD-dependent epimerase/dehydratase family protein [Parachlamydiaceae bacterium]|nr:NAD-dependent epimerase/dehydratase family protein [Parachlamydiaceae bacterium]